MNVHFRVLMGVTGGLIAYSLRRAEIATWPFWTLLGCAVVAFVVWGKVREVKSDRIAARRARNVQFEEPEHRTSPSANPAGQDS